MANKNRLTSWILNNRQLLNPTFTEFSWPNRYFKGIFDFEVELRVNGISAIGRGIDVDRELALEKASSEAIERLLCQKLEISTVGVAISGEVSADSHAECEALERYFFKAHLRQMRPFQRIEVDSSPLSCLVKGFRDQFLELNRKSELVFYQMASPKDLVGIVCIITSDLGEKSLGLALNLESVKAARRAFYEALANFARYKDAPGEYSIGKVQSEKFWQLDCELFKKIELLIVLKESSDPLFRLPMITRELLDFSAIPELTGCPIQPVRFVEVSGELL